MFNRYLNTTKQDLIDIALGDPLRFMREGMFEELVRPQYELGFDDLRDMIKRVYNMNESSLRQKSDASKGSAGRLNKLGTNFRTWWYKRKIDNGFRDSANTNNKMILAEGDSWFQFPVFVEDIIDYLYNIENFALMSIAYGGDWITNIIHEEKYIEELSVHNPDVFLMSGGGNDLVGGSKVAVMVTNEMHYSGRFDSLMDLDAYADLTDMDRSEIFESQGYVLKEFYAFLITIKLQYHMIISSIQKSDCKDAKIILQGYDYAFPSLKSRFNPLNPMQWFVNKMLGTGKWLARPMLYKGITDKERQRKIVKLMIFEFNEMLKEIAHAFCNVTHIDCRGVAPRRADWYDELHLKSHKYREVAAVYRKVIDGLYEGERVVRVVGK